MLFLSSTEGKHDPRTSRLIDWIIPWKWQLRFLSSGKEEVQREHCGHRPWSWAWDKKREGRDRETRHSQSIRQLFLVDVCDSVLDKRREAKGLVSLSDCIFYRPGVAGDVLHPCHSLTHWVSQSVILFENIFKTLSVPRRKSYHMSCVICHVSHVICHMSHVTCHVSWFTDFFFQSPGVSQWRVCYQQGLPRLFFFKVWK